MTVLPELADHHAGPATLLFGKGGNGYDGGSGGNAYLYGRGGNGGDAGWGLNLIPAHK
jgi:hypothetical protein